MPKTRCKLVYQFDELEEKAKEKARDWYRNGAFDYEWWDCTYEDAKTCLGLLGFQVDRIYFSGFSSQGDGACFEGSWNAKDYQCGAILKHAPKDPDLKALNTNLGQLAKAFPLLSMSVRHSGHYQHEFCTDFSVSDTCKAQPNEDEDLETSKETEDALIEYSRDAMRWIYCRLEQEFDYMNADEQVDESIRANEYEFTEDGNRYR